MRPKFFLALAAACCALPLLASPSFAAVEGVQTGNPITALMAPAGCGALAFGIPEPTFMTCTVQVECGDGSVKSCSGSTCSTSGSNNECVTCNGFQQGCCTGGPTCCQLCAADREDCFNNCPEGLLCNWCNNVVYHNCIANCTGGCS